MEGWDLGRGESRLTLQQFQRAQGLRAGAQAIAVEMRHECVVARFHCGVFCILPMQRVVSRPRATQPAKAGEGFR